MTDITELAQSLKAAVENAIGAHERLAAYPYGEIIDISQHEGEQIDIDITDLNEFNKEANPVNILALVEALEKAQRANAAQDDHINQQQDRIESLEKNAELGKYAGELESRTVTVKLPPELYTIGELIRTQDNRITDQPIFVVFQKREIIGSDEHSPSRICWVWDGEEVSELRAKRLEALYQNGRDIRGYDRYAMQEVDEFVTACFTEHGCKDFLRQNGHNLRKPYIYACGSFRNNEYQLVRNWLAGIKAEAE
ncbi:ead/Ea22-like family protein [Klebsiella pneumoniae]